MTDDGTFWQTPEDWVAECDGLRKELDAARAELTTERRRRVIIEQNETALAESCKGLVEVLATARTEREAARADLATLRRLAREVTDNIDISDPGKALAIAARALVAALPTETP